MAYEYLLAGYTPALLAVAATMAIFLQGKFWLAPRVAVGGAVGLAALALLVWVTSSL